MEIFFKNLIHLTSLTKEFIIKINQYSVNYGLEDTKEIIALSKDNEIEMKNNDIDNYIIGRSFIEDNLNFIKDLSEQYNIINNKYYTIEELQNAQKGTYLYELDFLYLILVELVISSKELDFNTKTIKNFLNKNKEHPYVPRIKNALDKTVSLCDDENITKYLVELGDIVHSIPEIKIDERGSFIN